ncbi:MAG: ABC transporter ATP-binding protein/permease [Chitinophagales bacterium]|nr:ABC transporter ATP-binding protein/permease [Chitinophagales bacterium]
MIFVISSNIFALFLPQLIRIGIEQIQVYLPFTYNFKGLGISSLYIDWVILLLAVISALIVITTLIRGALMFAMRQTLIVMSRHIEYDQKNELYNHYQNLTSSFFKRNSTGDMMSRISEDVSRVRMYVGPSIMYVSSFITTFVLVIYSMLVINPYLTFWTLIPLPLLVYSIYTLSRIVNVKSEKIQKILSDLTTSAQEAYSGIRIVKGYARDEQIQQEFEELAADYRVKSLSLARMESFFRPLMLFLIGTSTLLAIYIGGLEVAKGRFTAGNIAEFVVYINMLTWPVYSLGYVVSLVQRAAASQKRIDEFLKIHPDIVSGKRYKIDTIESIRFENVTLTYEDTGITALKDVSFEIKQGEKVAIVGKTGSGKSTICELLIRNYDPTSGKIFINGHPLDEIESISFRAMYGYVPQEVFLFSDSVKNNIRFGRPTASDEEVIYYAKAASVHEDIESLPRKYDTIVGERGVMLSGGQKQRISIARALIKDPSALVFDDCLSAVDAKTEHHILSNFEKEWKNRTVISITHRLFTVRDFDKILVFEGGRLVEQGKHQDLYDKGAHYFDLYQLQIHEEVE